MGWNHKLTHEQRTELVHRVATYELTDQQAAEEYRIARRSVYYLCRESEAYAALFEQAREEWRKRVREEVLATAEGQVQEMIEMFNQVRGRIQTPKDAAHAVKVLDGIARRLGLDKVREGAGQLGAPNPLSAMLNVLLAGQGATVNIVGAMEQAKVLKEKRAALLAEAGSRSLPEAQQDDRADGGGEG